MNIDKADQNQNSEANLISDKDNQKNLEGNLNKIKKANENYKKSKITVALDDFNNLNIKQKMKILNEQNIHLKDFLKEIKKKNNTKSSLNEKNSEIFKNRKIEKDHKNDHRINNTTITSNIKNINLKENLAHKNIISRLKNNELDSPVKSVDLNGLNKNSKINFENLKNQEKENLSKLNGKEYDIKKDSKKEIRCLNEDKFKLEDTKINEINLMDINSSHSNEKEKSVLFELRNNYDEYAYKKVNNNINKSDSFSPENLHNKSYNSSFRIKVNKKINSNISDCENSIVSKKLYVEDSKNKTSNMNFNYYDIQNNKISSNDNQSKFFKKSISQTNNSPEIKFNFNKKFNFNENQDKLESSSFYNSNKINTYKKNKNYNKTNENEMILEDLISPLNLENNLFKIETNNSNSKFGSLCKMNRNNQQNKLNSDINIINSIENGENENFNLIKQKDSNSILKSPSKEFKSKKNSKENFMKNTQINRINSQMKANSKTEQKSSSTKIKFIHEAEANKLKKMITMNFIKLINQKNSDESDSEIENKQVDKINFETDNKLENNIKNEFVRKKLINIKNGNADLQDKQTNANFDDNSLKYLNKGKNNEDNSFVSLNIDNNNNFVHKNSFHKNFKSQSAELNEINTEYQKNHKNKNQDIVTDLSFKDIQTNLQKREIINNNQMESHQEKINEENKSKKRFQFYNELFSPIKENDIYNIIKKNKDSSISQKEFRKIQSNVKENLDEFKNNDEFSLYLNKISNTNLNFSTIKGDLMKMDNINLNLKEDLSIEKATNILNSQINTNNIIVTNLPNESLINKSNNNINNESKSKINILHDFNYNNNLLACNNRQEKNIIDKFQKNPDLSIKRTESDSDEIKKKVEFQYTRKKKVYDSLSENEEINRFRDSNKIYINPLSEFKYVIDLLSFFTCIYTVFYLPLRLIYYTEPSLVNVFIEFICDFFMLLDFLLGFITAYYDFEENFITTFSKTTLNYIRTFFIIDLVSAIPFNSILEWEHYKQDFITNPKKFELLSFNPFKAFEFQHHSQLEFMNNFFIFGKSGQYYNHLLFVNFRNSNRILKSLRVFKAIKVFSNNLFVSKTIDFLVDDISYINTHLKFFLYYGVFLVISHILTCIYIFLGTVDYPNWIIYSHLENSNFGQIYLSSLYFNHTTIFTVGYGDVLSKNNFERSYNMILMIVGIMLYSFALTSISNNVKMNDEKSKDYEKKKEYLNEVSTKYIIHKDLYDQLSRHLMHQKKIDKSNTLDFLNELPITLRNEMILNMNKRIIASLNFFKNCFDNDFIIQVIIALKPTTCARKDILIKQGDFIEEIIFVKHGIIQFETIIRIEEEIEGNPYQMNQFNFPEISNKDISTEKIKILELRKNEHFGDSLMIDNIRSPITLSTKTKFADLYLMNKMDVMRLVDIFPSTFEKIYEKSSINYQRIFEKILKLKEQNLILKNKIQNKNGKESNKNKHFLDLNFILDKEISKHQHENKGKDNSIKLKIKKVLDLEKKRTKFFINLSKNNSNKEFNYQENEDDSIENKQNFLELLSNRILNQSANQIFDIENCSISDRKENKNLEKSNFLKVNNLLSSRSHNKRNSFDINNKDSELNSSRSNKFKNEESILEKKDKASNSEFINKRNTLKGNFETGNIIIEKNTKKVKFPDNLSNEIKNSISSIDSSLIANQIINNSLKINPSLNSDKKSINQSIIIHQNISDYNFEKDSYELNHNGQILNKKRNTFEDSLIPNENSSENSYLKNININNIPEIIPKIFLNNSFKNDNISDYRKIDFKNQSTENVKLHSPKTLYFNKNNLKKNSENINQSNLILQNNNCKKDDFHELIYLDDKNHKDISNDLILEIKQDSNFIGNEMFNKFDKKFLKTFEEDALEKSIRIISRKNDCLINEYNSNLMAQNNLEKNKSNFNEEMTKKNDLEKSSKSVSSLSGQEIKTGKNIFYKEESSFVKDNLKKNNKEEFDFFYDKKSVNIYVKNKKECEKTKKNHLSNSQLLITSPKILLCEKCNCFIKCKINKIEKKIYELYNEEYVVQNVDNICLLGSTEEDSSGKDSTYKNIKLKAKNKNYNNLNIKNNKININNIHINNSNSNFPITIETTNNQKNNVNIQNILKKKSKKNNDNAKKGSKKNINDLENKDIVEKINNPLHELIEIYSSKENIYINKLHLKEDSNWMITEDVTNKEKRIKTQSDYFLDDENENLNPEESKNILNSLNKDSYEPYSSTIKNYFSNRDATCSNKTVLKTKGLTSKSSKNVSINKTEMEKGQLYKLNSSSKEQAISIANNSEENINDNEKNTNFNKFKQMKNIDLFENILRNNVAFANFKSSRNIKKSRIFELNNQTDMKNHNISAQEKSVKEAIKRKITKKSLKKTLNSNKKDKKNKDIPVIKKLSDFNVLPQKGNLPVLKLLDKEDSNNSGYNSSSDESIIKLDKLKFKKDEKINCKKEKKLGKSKSKNLKNKYNKLKKKIKTKEEIENLQSSQVGNFKEILSNFKFLNDKELSKSFISKLNPSQNNVNNLLKNKNEKLNQIINSENNKNVNNQKFIDFKNNNSLKNSNDLLFNAFKQSFKIKKKEIKNQINNDEINKKLDNIMNLLKI